MHKPWDLPVFGMDIEDLLPHRYPCYMAFVDTREELLIKSGLDLNGNATSVKTDGMQAAALHQGMT